MLKSVFDPNGETAFIKEKAALDLIIDGGYSEDLLTLLCYADYHVTEYILGAGPQKVTVAYGGTTTEAGWEMVEKAGGMHWVTGAKTLTKEEYEEEVLLYTEETLRMALTHAVSGRETVVFLHPAAPMDVIAIEVWSAVAHWDVQEGPNGQLLAARYGVPEWDPEHSQTLEVLRRRITAAAATDALAGKRLESIEDITRHYREMGAYGDLTPYDDSDETFTPMQPPPPRSLRKEDNFQRAPRPRPERHGPHPPRLQPRPRRKSARDTRPPPPGPGRHPPSGHRPRRQCRR